MARSDNLKRLLSAYTSHDEAGFRDAVAELISEERRRGHHVLAEDLHSIMLQRNGTTPRTPASLLPLPQRQRDAGDLITFREPRASFEDLVLAPSTRARIESVVTELRHARTLRSANLCPSQKLLFYGPPGCGKTITAEALAKEVGLPFANARVDSIVSSLLGETSANMRRVFDFANTQPCVLLLDEFDSIGKSRDDPHELGELKRVVNSFLQMLDAYSGEGLVIAATNHEQLLDSALWRRFDEVIPFPRPTSSDLAQLLRLLTRGVEKSAIVPSRIVRAFHGLSHADVTSIVRGTIKSVVIGGRTSVGTTDLLDAAQQYKTRFQAAKQNSRRQTKRSLR